MTPFKTIGIIGGMGPAATALLFQKIIENTDAKSDGEHPRIVIDNNPAIPDRTQSILHGDQAPLAPIVEAGNGLIAQGANVLLLPCITAHYFLPEIRRRLSVPVLSLPKATATYCRHRGLRTVAVLATTGTVCSDVFGKELRRHGIRVLYPTDAGQEQLMRLIYEQLKAGKPAERDVLLPHLQALSRQGAQAYILGCTELPLIYRDGDFGWHFIDVLTVAARRALRAIGCPTREPLREV